MRSTPGPFRGFVLWQTPGLTCKFKPTQERFAYDRSSLFCLFVGDKVAGLMNNEVRLKCIDI